MKKPTFLDGLFLIGLLTPHFAFSEKAFPDSDSGPGRGIKVKVVAPVYTVEIKDVTLYEGTIPIFFHIQLPKIPEEFPHAHHSFSNCSRNRGQGQNFSRESDSTREYNQYHCALERQFILASNHIVKDLQEMQKMQILSKHEPQSNPDHPNKNKGAPSPKTQAPARKKRQAAPVLAATSLLAGFLLRPAVSKFTGNLFGSNEEWTSHFNSIRESLIKDHELLLDFEHSTQAYTQEMSNILTTMSLLISEQKRDLIWSLRLLSTKMHADLIQDAINSCKSKHLPGNLIKPSFLQKTLAALDKNLTLAFNYSLAINSGNDELGKYYKLPIVDCLFTEDKAHITVNVPLVRNGAKWRLYEIIHAKYQFHSQVCELYPQEASYLAEEETETGSGTEGPEGGRSVLITNHMLRYCSIHEDRLCMIPQFAKDSVQSLKCTSGAAKVNGFKRKIFSRNNLEILLKSCSFRCYSSDEVIITQVDGQGHGQGQSKIVVTNAKNLTYKCEDGDDSQKVIRMGRLGAVEIDLECGCSLKINGEERLSSPFPCAYRSDGGFNGSGNNDMFSFTVPFAWAHNLSQIFNDDQLFIDSHEKLGVHVNHEWSRLIPVLNFSKEHVEKELNFTVPEKAEVKYSAALITVEVWLGLLTAIVVIHVGLTVYCCFRLFFVRFGEYELPNSYREREDQTDGWTVRRRKRSRSIEGHSHSHRHQSNRNSQGGGGSSTRSSSASNGSGSGRNNRRQNLEIYQKQAGGEHDKLNESPISLNEDTYNSNRNSVINKLI